VELNDGGKLKKEREIEIISGAVTVFFELMRYLRSVPAAGRDLCIVV
jgi:hypothetical protein